MKTKYSLAWALLGFFVGCGPDEPTPTPPATYTVSARMELNETEKAKAEEIVKAFPAGEATAVRAQLHKGGLIFSKNPDTQKKINDLRAEMGNRWAVEQDSKPFVVPVKSEENTYNPTAEEHKLINELLQRIEPSRRNSLRDRLLRSDAQVLSVRDAEGDKLLKKIYALRAARKD